MGFASISHTKVTDLETHLSDIDDEPTFGSDNLVKSGGVEATKVNIKCGVNLLNPKACVVNALVNTTNGKINTASGVYASDFIPVSQNGLIYRKSAAGVYGGTAVYDKQKKTIFVQQVPNIMNIKKVMGILESLAKV